MKLCIWNLTFQCPWPCKGSTCRLSECLFCWEQTEFEFQAPVSIVTCMKYMSNLVWYPNLFQSNHMPFHPPSSTLVWQAFYRNMVAPTYVWITPGWYSPLWWTTSSNSSCQAYTMREALNHSLSVIPDGYLITKNSSVSTLVSRVQFSNPCSNTSRYSSTDPLYTV